MSLAEPGAGGGRRRAYRTAALARLGLDSVSSQGYCFQVDLGLAGVH
jgi:hypothetical protein